MELIFFGFIGCVIAMTIIGGYRRSGSGSSRRDDGVGGSSWMFWSSGDSTLHTHDSHNHHTHDHGHTHHSGCDHGGHDSGGSCDSGGGGDGGGGDGGGGGGSSD